MAAPEPSFSPPLERRRIRQFRFVTSRLLLITAPPGHEKYFDELETLLPRQAGPRGAREVACQVRRGEFATLPADDLYFLRSSAAEKVRRVHDSRSRWKCRSWVRRVGLSERKERPLLPR